MKRTLVAACISFLLVMAGCGDRHTRAQKELERKKIPVTADAFLENVEKGNYEIALLFLDAGVSTELKGFNGRSPLHSAVNYGHTPIVELLLSRGAQVNTKNDKEVTPLFLAVLNQNRGIVKILLEKGADPTIIAHDRESPLGLAAKGVSSEIVRMLVEKGADPDSKDGAGFTPLHNACSYSHSLEIAQVLISHGADINALNGQGFTALDMARSSEKSNQSLVIFLKEKGGKTGKEIKKPDTIKK